MVEQTSDITGPDSPDGGYQVLARKYRPSTFADLLGQDAMVQTLTNAFKANRIAQAYMLTGVRGVGKTTTARLIARALNFVEPGKESVPTTDFSVMGEHCQAIMESRHVDVIEMDAASKTGIGEMRDIIDAVRYKPVSAPYKVYIIDEIHMLSKQAFNALLKTLEEPPEHVKFIFATTEIRKVPITVLSRCQRFDLMRFDASLLVQLLGDVAKKENVEADDEALRLIARAAEGSARDGLSLLDQAIAYGGNQVKTEDVQNMLGLVDRARVIDLFEAVMAGDIAKVLAELGEQYDLGADPHTMLSDFAGFVHLVTRAKAVPDSAPNAALTEVERVKGKELALKLSMPVLTRAWQMALKGLSEVLTAGNAMMATEMVFIRLAYAADLPNPDTLVKNISDQPTKSVAPARSESGASSQPLPTAQGSAPFEGNVVQMAPHMQGANAAVAQSHAVDVSDLKEVPQDQFNSFQDIVDLAGKMRDIKLKTMLETKVRPIKVSTGKIEIALEAGATKSLASELTRKMEAWTGLRWMVLIARDGGDEPLHVVKEKQRDTLFRRAREIPLVETIFATFPGAEIVDVRDLAPVEQHADFDETDES